VYHQPMLQTDVGKKMKLPCSLPATVLLSKLPPGGVLVVPGELVTEISADAVCFGFGGFEVSGGPDFTVSVIPPEKIFKLE